MSHHLWCFLIPCIIDWRLRPTPYGFASYYSSFEADCDAAILVLDLRIRNLRLHLGWDLSRCGQPLRSYLRMFILNTVAGHNYCSAVLCSCFCGTSSSMMSAAVRSWSALSRPAGGRSLLHVGSLILSTDLLAYLGYCCIHPNHRRLQFGNSFGFCFETLVNLVLSITFSSVCKYFGCQPRLSGIGFCLQSTWLSWSAVAEVAWAASYHDCARCLAFRSEMLLACAAPWRLRWGWPRLQFFWVEFVNYFSSTSPHLVDSSDRSWASCGIGNTPEPSSESELLADLFNEKGPRYFLLGGHCLEAGESCSCSWQSSHSGDEL